MREFIFFFFNYLLSFCSCTYSQRLIVEKQNRLCNTSSETKKQDSGGISSHRHHSPILISLWTSYEFFNKQVIFSETKSQTTYWCINHFYYNIPLLPKPVLGPLFYNKRFYQLRSIIMKQTPLIQILYHIYIFIYNIPKKKQTNKQITSTNKGLLNEPTQLTTQAESLHILSIYNSYYLYILIGDKSVPNISSIQKHPCYRKLKICTPKNKKLWQRPKLDKT